MSDYYNGSPKKQPAALTEENYVEIAEEAILALKNMKKNGKPIQMLTTSQIRNLLAMTADIYNEVLECKPEKLGSEIVERINYLRVRFIYEAGRDNKVKAFVEKTNVIEYLKKAKNSKTEYIRFSRYMEALVAFHRYYGGRD